MTHKATAEQLSSAQRQLIWLALPVAAGLITGIHVAVGGPHPDAIFTWTMATLALIPGLVKMLRHQLRTQDSFWLAQSVSGAGTVFTTAVSYAGIWLGALAAIALVELYTSPGGAPAGTVALGTIVTIATPAVRAGWRRLGHQD